MKRHSYTIIFVNDAAVKCLLKKGAKNVKGYNDKEIHTMSNKSDQQRNSL